MPKRPCIETTCSGFAVYRGRCELHARKREHETHRRPRPVATRTPRPTPAIPPLRRRGRIYDTKRWRILRVRKLAASPICEECEDALATEVDHLTPIEEGGAPYAWSNLRSLCAPCHSVKTAAEVRARVYA